MYSASKGFSLAWLLAFTKSFAWLVSAVVCRVVGLFTRREKPLQQAARYFRWACPRLIIRCYRDNDVNFITWKNFYAVSKTNFTRPISGKWMMVNDFRTTKRGWFSKSLYPNYFSLLLQYSLDKLPSEEFSRGELNRFKRALSLKHYLTYGRIFSIYKIIQHHGLIRSYRLDYGTVQAFGSLLFWTISWNASRVRTSHAGSGLHSKSVKN